MSKKKKKYKLTRKKKGDDGMQAVLKEENNSILKLQLLKSRANNVLKDNSLRHLPSEHDIKKCSENTKLLHTHQQNTIGKGD